MAIFWFKLRRNITMDGDLQLARLELQSFVCDVDDVDVLSSRDFPTLSNDVREGQQGYSAQCDVMLLPMLIRRLTFIQRIYVIADDTDQILEMLNHVSPVVTYRSQEEKLYLEAIPHYALFEYAEVIARKAKSAQVVKAQLSLLLDGLLNRQSDKDTQSVITMVMSAQMTTSPLSHGIHYYKAKFFPRMARSMLNITSGYQDVSNLTVLDPFVGSGTTLLEAAQLGMPSYGVDLDPLSVKISHAKLDILHQDSDAFASVVDALQQNIKMGHAGCNLRPIVFPDWLMKNRKMTSELASDLITEIDHLRASVCHIDEKMRDIVWVIMSDAITRRIKFRFLGTGVGRFSLTLSKTPLEKLFTHALENQYHSLVAWEWLRDTLGLILSDAQIMTGDARRLDDIPQVDLIVTSPPYLPASSGRESYTKARMPSLLALGMHTQDTIDQLVDSAVGSMDSGQGRLYQATDEVMRLVNWLENDNLRQTKAQPTARYFADMRQTFRTMHEKLVDGGQIVLVSGRQSTFYRSSTREILYSVPVADMLAQEAELAGLHIDQLLHIPLKKLNRNARPRSLDDYDETLIFMSKC